MAAPTFPTKSELLTLINTYLQTNGTILATEHNDIETGIVNAIYGGQVGDIKEISCDLTYVTNNFIIGTADINEGRALSTSERYGWAICNGKNGTVDKRGNVAIGYDPINYPLTAPGPNNGSPGTKTVTLTINQMPTHSHDIQFRRDSTTSGNYLTLANTSNGDEGTFGTETGGNTATGNVRILDKGGNQPHNNMQPYIVTLFIQRIAPY